MTIDKESIRGNKFQLGELNYRIINILSYLYTVNYTGINQVNITLMELVY